MKILIAGGFGFIGKNLIKYFSEKYNVYEIYAPTSKELDCLKEEQVRKCLQETYYDVVINLAVYGDGIDKSKDGTKMLEYNLIMFHNFAKYSKYYGKMIYAGSGAEFDKRYPINNFSENDIDARIPADQYGLMKYTITKIIDKSDNIYNLRLFGVYGPYEYWQRRFISNACCRVVYDMPITINRNVVFDYIWIDDLCEIIIQFMNLKEPKFHTYNAVRGEKIDLLSLAKIVKKVSGKNVPIVIKNEGMSNEYTASNERLISEIPNIKFTDYEESISYLYRWYEEHKNEINPEELV